VHQLFDVTHGGLEDFNRTVEPFALIRGKLPFRISVPALPRVTGTDMPNRIHLPSKTIDKSPRRCFCDGAASRQSTAVVRAAVRRVFVLKAEDFLAVGTCWHMISGLKETGLPFTRQSRKEAPGMLPGDTAFHLAGFYLARLPAHAEPDRVVVRVTDAFRSVWNMGM
jgi:hypothetical protein